jgi:hypothetical protein
MLISADSRGAKGMVAIRLAGPGDASAILAILVEVAREIPVLTAPEARWTLLATRVDATCRAGLSRVAIDDRGAVVGFLLVEPDQAERFLSDNGALHLPYAGVARAHRGRGALRGLIAAVMEERVPLTVTVKRTNTSSMVDRLKHLRFSISEERDDEVGLRWSPT